jgi:uncharacterized protein YndB with AHSA1/START domain
MEKRAKWITVQATINVILEKAWAYWTTPAHIKKWNNASEDWHTPIAEVDLRVGGKFLSRMESKDGQMGFDFIGTYDEVKKMDRLSYTLEDGRKVKISFADKSNKTKIIETFESENIHTIELQRDGWQAILNNFKKYAEGLET